MICQRLLSAGPSLVVALGLVAAAPSAALAERVEPRGVSAPLAAPADSTAAPLAGRVVVLDPGHQLGNARFPGRINRPVPAGPFRKPCNTTGTATNGGFPEATFTWQVAQRLQARLLAQGARVVLTRTSNSPRRWGPCVDVRGRAGNRVDADLKVSIHGDGSYAARARGFHIIAPRPIRRWTTDIAKPSRRLASAMRTGLLRAGFPRANYTAGGDGLDFRGDLATLNLSDVPTVMVELGNMRSAADAAVMTSPHGQERYADGLLAGVLRFLR